MSSSRILHSAALQKSLALTPARTPSSSGASFSATLAKAQSRVKPVSGTSSGVPPTAGAVPYRAEIAAAATKYGLDPALLAGLVKQESNFNPHAQSRAGAKGLTQLMDQTARGLGVTDAFDAGQSLDAGAKFLGGLLKQFHGNESLALAAYNAGPAAVQKYGGIPPYEETQRYVPKVLGYAAQFRRIWADGKASRES